MNFLPSPQKKSKEMVGYSTQIILNKIVALHESVDRQQKWNLPSFTDSTMLPLFDKEMVFDDSNAGSHSSLKMLKTFSMMASLL
jgi:hypothetical protein